MARHRESRLYSSGATFSPLEKLLALADEVVE
jgi:hypothetical protein